MLSAHTVMFFVDSNFANLQYCHTVKFYVYNYYTIMLYILYVYPNFVNLQYSVCGTPCACFWLVWCCIRGGQLATVAACIRYEQSFFPPGIDAHAQWRKIQLGYMKYCSAVKNSHHNLKKYLDPAKLASLAPYKLAYVIAQWNKPFSDCTMCVDFAAAADPLSKVFTNMASSWYLFLHEG